ncbi:IclR family transcriptional regulator [Gluconacetobacter tumulisoli]|uniref:IclR family transcriptional regulator n=1 Tax=Gluconacetobacter tumulisoli TaxID=1286189 RepID=A0A7W4K6Y5_9PROT|nr:IclR family transcriptional regulator [Gluconacetobacter tumulisoli]MBB2201530.1 IclR family transcriptional regulator [Gluconacetobacter tumulisoli]
MAPPGQRSTRFSAEKPLAEPLIHKADETASGSKSKSPAINRSYDILDLLANARSPVLSRADITQQMGLPRSSTANLLSALEECGLVERMGNDYSLGRKIVTLASAYLRKFDPVQEFYRFCSNSDILKDETVRIAILDRNEIIYIARYEGHPAIHLTSNIGDHMPVSLCAVGKAIVSRLDDEDVQKMFTGVKILPVMTEHSIRTVTQLRKELKETRLRGYAIEDEEATPGVMCLGIAVPTRGVNGPKMGVSVSSVKVTFDQQRHARLLEGLQSLVRAIGSPLDGVG